MLIRRLCAAAAAVLCGVLCLAGCSHKENTGAGFLFTCTLADNPGCLDPQFTDNPYASAVLANTMEGLMRLDAAGNPVCAEALNYAVSKNGLHYTFTLRDDCYWFSPDSDPERPEIFRLKNLNRSKILPCQELGTSSTRAGRKNKFAVFALADEDISSKEIDHLVQDLFFA